MEGYKVMESFYSIQGEGYHTGKSAYFIRLAGCDIGCSWCDVKESWDVNNSGNMGVEALIKMVVASGAKMAIITGGEPTMYDLSPLTIALHEYGIKTHLETSGVYKITGDWDWICISPKKFKGPLSSEMTKADELKVIVVNKSDLKWAEEHSSLVKDTCKLFLQPEWEKSDKVIDSIDNYVKDFPKWRISLQTHKYMNIR
jgi:7-carboxy-7-deazaguanine synthase